MSTRAKPDLAIRLKDPKGYQEQRVSAAWHQLAYERGEYAHLLFAEFLPSIGYLPSRKVRVGEILISPDGFTPEGYPVELKSASGLKSPRSGRGQLRHYMRVLGMPEGELWMYTMDEANVPTFVFDSIVIPLSAQRRFRV